MDAPPAQVLLVSMPFSQATLPSLGLSLLRAELKARGIEAAIRYFFVEFAHRVGLARYEEIIDQDQSRLLGEWVFAPALHGGVTAEQTERFWRAAFPKAGATKLARLRAAISTLQEDASRFIEEVASATPWEQYRLVGFSTTFHQTVASLALAQRIKARSPGTQIVFGGANCESEMGMALLRNYPFIDYAFSGEADETFPPFVQELLEGHRPSDRNGLLRRDDATGEPVKPAAWVSPVENLDSLPEVEFDDYFAQAAPLIEASPDHFRIALPFETARGCWWGQKHHCTFCGLNGSTMAFRSKSAQRAISEVHTLLDRYGDKVHRLRAVDNILDMRYFAEFLPALGRHPKLRPVFYEVKSNLSRKQIQALADAQVMDLQPGIESLSSSVLQLMRKGVTALRNVQFLRWCSEAGVRPSWNIIFGFPREDPAEYAAVTRLIPYLRHLQPPTGYSQLRLDRFSPYFGDPASFGMVNTRPYGTYDAVFQLPDAQLRDLAYYFEFDYEDGRSLEYASEMEKLCRQWTKSGGSYSLVGFTTPDRYIVWDTRPVAKAPWMSLRGIHRAILLACDSICSYDGLLRDIPAALGSAVDAAQLDGALSDLESWGLLMREGQQYLSLVVLPRDAVAPNLPHHLVTELPQPADLPHVPAPVTHPQGEAR